LSSARRAALLDRDGTLIVEKDYLADPDGAVLEAGAAAGLRQLAQLGLVLVVVSNQSGIGRGYFTRERADAVNARVDQLLRAEGVEIAGWYLCPHAPDEVCDCRKPLPGLAHAAAADLGLDLKRSFVIGDKPADVELARAVGATGLLVLTGHGAEHRGWAETEGVPTCPDLFAAAEAIRERMRP
jgi:histidinol-phosphate phosphatase family protein